MGSPEPSGARKREKGRVLSNATGGIDAAAAWPERGGAGNNQYSTNDERRDNGVNSAGWSTAGRRWGACARHRPRELRDRLILMDGYIDDDDDGDELMMMMILMVVMLSVSSGSSCWLPAAAAAATANATARHSQSVGRG